MADIITSDIEISSGVVSSGLSVGMGAAVTVLTGGTVTDAEASEYGFFWVSEGALVRDIYLHDSGDVFLDGGRAENLTMETGGQADIMGGVLHTGTIRNGGVGVIYTGASGLEVTVSAGGRFQVYGGYAADTVVESGGSFVVQMSDGLAANTVVSSGGHARIVSGGHASRTTLNGGRVDMLSGYMYDTAISSGGTFEIMSGQAYNTDVFEGGSMAVSAAGEAHNAVVKGGALNVLSGTVYDANVLSGSALLLDAAAFRLNVSGGTVHARGGTYITNGRVSGGVLSVSSGAILNKVSFNGGTLDAGSGALVSSCTFYTTGGVLNVSSGATFRKTGFTSGTMAVQAGANVSATTIWGDGVMVVSSGALVRETAANLEGMLVLEGGGSADMVTVYGTSDYSGGVYSLNSDCGRMVVSSGAVAANVQVACGRVNVSGGLISGLTMNKGEIVIGAGGVVRDAVLKGSRSGGSIFITGGDLDASFGGYSGVPFLTGGGISSVDIVTAGTGGGTGGGTDGSNLTGDVVILPSGPSIISDPDDPGNIIVIPGITWSVNPVIINRYTPTLGYLTIESGGLLEDAVASAMQITVADGGVARNLSASDYTWITVSSGGLLTGRMSFVSGTTVTVSSGGIVDFDLSALAPNKQALLTGTGSIQGAPLYTITVSDSQSEGRYALLDGAAAFTGTLTVRSTEWAALGTLTVDTLTEIGGRYYLAKAKRNTLYLHIWNEMPTILPDPETVYLNTTWSELESGTVVSLSGGGTATVGYDAFAELEAASDAVAEQGTVIITGCDAAIPGVLSGNVAVAEDASVTGCTVGASGLLTLKSGSSARDVAVLSGGTVTVEEGAVLTVTKSFTNSNGLVTVDGTFNFDISGTSGLSSTDALVTSLVNIQGAPTFTLTVGAGQANGAYRLTSTDDGSTDFVLTVVDASGAALGTVALRYTLQADGSYLETRTDAVIGGRRYSLRKNAVYSYYFQFNGLTLTITPESEMPYYTYVDASLTGKIAGDQASFVNPDTGLTDTCTFGVDAFDTLEAAFAAVDENGVVSITGGTFSPAAGITRNVILGSGMQIYLGPVSGGVLENTTVYRSLTVKNGGLARDLTVASGGSVSIVSGGTVQHLTVAAGGTLGMESGILSGGTFDAASSITVDGTLEFDISGMTPGGPALFDGLAYVGGTPNCTILVSADQAQGVYVLGVNAAGFAPYFAIGEKSSSGSNPYIIVSADTASGAPRKPNVITVGGIYCAGGVSYAISETDGVLTLTVGSYEMPETVHVDSEWEGLASGTVVTLSGGATATYGVDAFASLATAYAVASPDATIYIDGGTVVLDDLENEKTRKTIALAGSVLRGGTGSQRYTYDLTLESGATADSIDFNYGVLTVKSGATLAGIGRSASSATVELYDGAILGGTFTASGKAVLRDVASLDGTFVVTSNGTLTGSAEFTEDMDITVDGLIEFDLTGTTAGAPVLFRGLSFLKGTASGYAITISSSLAQQTGVYLLADGVSDFAGTVALRTDSGTKLGDLEIGKGVMLGGLVYTLRGLPSDGKYVLSLVVDDENLPPLEYVYVNSSWANKKFGDIINVTGGTALYMYDAFSNLENAFAVLPYGGTVGITGGSFTIPEGTYSGTIVLDGSTLSLAPTSGTFSGSVSVTRKGYLTLTGAAASSVFITVDSNSTLTMSGPSVEAASITVDGTLEFDLFGATAGAAAIFDDFSRVRRGTSSSIAVRADTSLAAGTYLLATGATGVDQVTLRLGKGTTSTLVIGGMTYTMTSGETTYTLTVGGTALRTNGFDYSISLSESGELALNVSEYEKPSRVDVSSDWNGKKDGTKLTTPTQFGFQRTIGYDAFADLTAGLNAVAEGGMVVVRGKHTFSAANMKKCLLILDFNGGPGIEFSSCTLVTGNTVRAHSASLSGALTVSDGGTLTVGQEATFDVRRAVFLAGSTVTINGTLNFNISGMSPGGNALLSGLSFVEGAPKYLLTVSGSQADGKYILVSDGASFDGVITVKSTSGTEIGTLSVGQSILDTRVTYALDLDDSDRLCLTITTRPVPPTVYLDSTWNKLGTGTAVTLEDGSTVFIGYDAFGDATGFSKVAQGGTAVIHGGTVSASALRNAADIIVRGGIFDFGTGTVGSGQVITVGAGGRLDGPITVGSGGSVTVEADASLTDGVTVTAGGILTALSGAMLAEGVTISIGGTLNVEEGATLCVRNAVFAEGSLVVVNGTVFFDISGLSSDGDALFSGLSRFQGAPTYVLSLSAKQAPGKYILAADAGSFDGMITVTAAGAELTKIAVGDSVVSDRNLYELELDESGNLCFTVTRIGGVPCVHLDSDWKSQPYGKRIFLADDSPAIIGYDAFGDSDAFLEVADGGMAVVWNGKITSNGIGYAGNVIVREAELELTGGTVGSGRAVTVTAGGTLSGTFTVEAGGAVTVAAGATLCVRQAVFESGASILVDGVIDFDLTGMSAGDGALFHGLARVQGAPACTLTVNGKETGVYTLATDAGNYGGVITVKNASGTEFGTLSVGGKLNVLGRIYSLATDGAGTLSLEVSDVEKPARVYANSDWSGLEDGTVVVLLNGSTAIIGYNAFGDESVFKAPSSGTVVMEKGTFDASSGPWNNIIVLGDVSLISPTASSGKTITVGAGGTLSGYITVGSGGAVTVEAGGTLSLTTGFRFETGASVMVNGTLALDISRGPLGMNSRAYGADLVRGAPNWVLTVGAAQMTGTYYLDLNAHVDAVFTVVNTDGKTLGTLSVDSPLDADGLHYVLKHELIMNVLRETKIVVTEIPGEERPSYTNVNSEWAGLADGTEVSLPSGGAVAVIGRDAFASFDSAISACRDGVTIVGGTVRIDGNVEKFVGVSNGAVLVLNGEMHASFSVGSGATAENVTFACDSGQLRVSSGGTLRNFTVRDGNVFVSGKITGRMSIQGGCTVTLEKSASIDFDLSQFDGSAPLLNNMGCLYTVYADYPPVYTITVDGDLASGEYKLAGGGNSTRVDGLSCSIVNRAGDELGTITVGSRVALNGVVYSLYVAEDYILSLSVSAPDVTPPSITVETSTTALTNRDVSLTALVTDDGQLDGVYYRIGEEGEWKVYDFLKGVTVSQNCVVYFKAADIAGNVSEIVGCTVGNIDKTPPTMPGSLRAGVSGSMAALNWNASQDASGIGEYIVTYRLGEQEYTISTTAAGLTLDDLEVGTWTWSVRAVDKAGNASGFANGGTFTVTDEVVPEAEKQFFVGDFAGTGKPVLAKVSGGIVAIPGENGGLWGSLALEDGWSVAGIGDFDGDGKDDILRINEAGYVVGETSNGDGSFTAQVLNFKGAGWDILGVGDFDGDGKDDVLVANPTGASDTVGLLGYWKGGTEWTLINGYSATWEMISTGDFDGDGKCDMLWRNSFDGVDGRTYNAYCTWIMAPAEGEPDWRMVSVAAPDEWNYLCSGDFDGDGTADIAMINMEGVVGIWGVKNGWLDSWSILSAVDTSAWTLAGVGDFNGDGTDDIAWRNPEAGIAGCWQIEEKQLASWQPLAILA